MCPSTELNDAHVKFAADVLRNLLRHIDDENVKRHNPFLVSHAWTDGPLMFLVYTAPPSDRTWGLVRDTRESIIDRGPWPNLDEAVLYYFLVDFEENQPSSSSRQPGEPDTIWWFGYPRENLLTGRRASLRRIGIRRRPERPRLAPAKMKVAPPRNRACTGIPMSAPASSDQLQGTCR